MPTLTCDISESLMRALEARSRQTGEPVAHIVMASLSDTLEIDHSTLFQVSTSTALVEGVYGGVVTIGDANVIRENVTIHRAMQAGKETRIGSRCLLMVGSHVAHDCLATAVCAKPGMMPGRPLPWSRSSTRSASLPSTAWSRSMI